MENQLGFHQQHDKDDNDDVQVIIPNTMKDTIIIIMNPDQIMIRPFTNMDYKNDTTMIWHGQQYYNQSWFLPYPTGYQIQNFVPAGQLYHIGHHWVDDINRGIHTVLDAITLKKKKLHYHDNSNNDKDTLNHQYDNNTKNGLYTWTKDDVLRYYVVGPPYIGTAYDMYRIVIVWSNIVVHVYNLCYQAHLSEMYAYSTAAAYLNLRHLIAYTFMVSNTDLWVHEGWNDEIYTNINNQSINNNRKINANDDQYFLKWSNPDNSYSSNNDKINYTDLPLPNIIHYCQSYTLGPYDFNKYIFPKNILSCSHPMLLETPSLLMLNDDNDSTNINTTNIGNEKYWTTLNVTSTNRNRSSCGKIAFKYKTYNEDGAVDTYKTLTEVKRNTFFLCHIITKINDAIEFWKNTNCNNNNNNNSTIANNTNNNTNTDTNIINYQKIYVSPHTLMNAILLKPNME